MTGTELAIKLGYVISRDGIVALHGEPKKVAIHSGRHSMLFTFRYNNHKYTAYAGKMQAYFKFGDKALNDNTVYLDGNRENLNYDNISLVSIESKKSRDVTTKICTKCGRELPITQFCFKDKKNNRRAPRCLDCDRESKRESYHKYFEENKERFQQRRQQYKQGAKDLISDAKQNGCMVCGEKDPACLDFHHLKDKSFNIANKVGVVSNEMMQKEIDKCIILCANCHRKLHYYNIGIDELRQLVSVPKAAEDIEVWRAYNVKFPSHLLSN